MVDIRITIDDQKIYRRLKQLQNNFAAGGNVPALREIGRYGKSSTQLRFRSGRAPDGSRWPISQRARRKGGKTGRDTGRLRNSLIYKVSSQGVAWGTNVVYGPAFHFGKRDIEQVAAHRRTQTVVFGRRLRQPIQTRVRAHTRRANQPPRPFLGLSRADRDAILGILKRHLRRAGAK